jgi:2-dehydropantoate 2-reductase
LRFIVYGAGAIGSILGGHLFRTGHEVVLVGNSEHVDRIHESGLRLVTPDETYVLKVPACKQADELRPFRDDDILLLTAKSQHTLNCLGQLKNAGSRRTLPIFCAQNSILNESLATRIFDRVYGVVVSISGIFLQPGEVINSNAGNNGFLEIGRYPSGSDEMARQVRESFRRAGFEAGINDFIMRAKAAKCLGNLANAMRAITNDRGDSGKFMEATRREATQVWKAAGIEWEDRGEFLERIRKKRTMATLPKGYLSIDGHPSSSWQSLTKGTGNIEAEQLNGDIVKLGAELGIRTPYNERLWRLADEMAKKREKPGKYTAEDLEKMLK